MDYIIYLVIIAAVIILSEISSFLSKQMKIQGTVIVPLIVGFILNALFTNDNLSINLGELTPIFLAIAGIGLIFFVFDSTAKAGIKNMDTSHSKAFKLFLITFLLNMSILTYFIMQISNAAILPAIIFSIAFTGTSPIFFNDWQSKIREVLSKEAIIATPILLILGYFVYDILSIQNGVPHFFAPRMSPYALEVLISLGVGVLAGIIFFNTIRRFHRNKVSKIIIISTAVASYILAELLGGDGVIATAVFAIFFGNMHLIEREKTTGFLEKILAPLYIILILILGFSSGLNITPKIFFESIILLLILLLIRFISASLVFFNNHTLKEKIHLTLNTQHGASIILILLLLSLRGFPETTAVIQLSLLLLLYTAIISVFASLKDHKDKSLEKEQTI